MFLLNMVALKVWSFTKKAIKLYSKQVIHFFLANLYYQSYGNIIAQF